MPHLFFQLLLLCIFSLSPLYSDEGGSEKKDDDAQEKEEPPKIGNFALPTSQQPAALFGFGGNIIDEGEVQLYCFADKFVGNGQLVTDVIPSLLYGITNSFSVLFNVPFSPRMQNGVNRSSGLEDFFIQLEYAFYNKSTYTYSDQATVVFNASAPTGSVKKNPNTGFGSPTCFLGGTFYRSFVDWFFFTSHGALLTTSREETKIGNQFLYQCGFGRNIPSPEGWIYAWMVEFDGQYFEKNRLWGLIDPTSGGNYIFVTPSIWISSKRLLVQFGVSLPVYQSVPIGRDKFDYAINLNVAISFYK